jgi:hypothetical protein
LTQNTTPGATFNIGKLNNRYEPWDPLGLLQYRSGSKTKALLQLKDPMITRSDDWEFLNNKFPNAGWLGRIHRGTPWQTVYLKSPSLPWTNWQNWSGDLQMVTNYGQISTNLVPLSNPPTNAIMDAYFSHPTNDWALLDLFTTAFNENASHGLLSVNQTNLAAWSAVLGGVIALTNTLSDADLAGSRPLKPQFAPVAVQPAGVYDPASPPPLARIWKAINDTRWTNSPSHSFSKLGDILQVPELTVASPFLNTSSQNVLNRGITDAAYERLPQQILGLTKADQTPRFLIYAWGQTLEPADRSIITSGPYLGLCTNYQVTAEVAVRAVVRVEGAPANPHVVVEAYNVLPPD